MNGSDEEVMYYGEKQDNWENYCYVHQRYKDALASLFNIQICAAVTEKEDEPNVFLLSYNQPINEAQLAMSKKNLIQHVLTEKNIDEAEKFKRLVAAYVVFNVDLKCRVRNFIGKFLDSDDILEDISRHLRDYSIPEISHKINDYNRNIKNHKKTLFENKYESSFFDTICMKIYDEYREMKSETTHFYRKTRGSVFSRRFYEKLNDSNFPRHVFDFFERPKQDIRKLLKYVKNIHDLRFEILPNGMRKHSERNIIDRQPNSTYIGVAKLSCASCYDYITKYKQKYVVRGTSGLLFPGCINLHHSDDMRTKLENIENFSPCEDDYQKFYRQSRSLSHDDDDRESNAVKKSVFYGKKIRVFNPFLRKYATLNF